MDIRKIKKLIELVEESGVAELEITEGEESVRICRFSANLPAAVAAPAHTPAVPAILPAATQSEAAPAPEAEGQKVTAPMVGTYYSSPSPSAEPFVQVGDEVQVGDPLCIIEAMKMMNQIDAEVSGRIRAIQVENAEPVEFDQVLFVID
ncbi:MAG: acetyl-CoA carboxylase biotin carboxyl carrier protein [Gammaproteobacteria bacterium]|jgi:acetyl-CoA carboxylase biotin carboxyl carrier protein|nr:acetyl-CoA carboxylase, biotin carboxyl carrier protein [Chromatiales bacterium]MCP4926790.1 acetyl-CoA carboxylase biotin carboxyl carrier protein [Gammaproteobacteria bacterium]MDP7152836.1 acetyl-CoA carboxylase biotin carboxyl carrier protein [Gammaproteobacteria bacterium]MDP7295921.1 acetyl-CoA carboxylase biotin carboxyl carrier protein [Gammaproteobacteria bacterium]MDP7419652.1 acetyl-CoA carboxylase biotin carboxyl carrier protein [Gammaproteobacteria bacterium]